MTQNHTYRDTFVKISFGLFHYSIGNTREGGYPLKNMLIYIFQNIQRLKPPLHVEKFEFIIYLDINLFRGFSNFTCEIYTYIESPTPLLIAIGHTLRIFGEGILSK